MSNSRTARRYARALFKLAASDLSKAEQRYQRLSTMASLFDLKDAKEVFFSPVMPNDLKKSLFQLALSEDQDPELANFAQTLVDAGRSYLMPEVAKAFGALIDEAQGVVRAHVVSAIELSDQELEAISSSVGEILKKRAIVDQAVDGSLLGGFRVEVGNYLFDLSLKTKLDGLSHAAAVDSLR